MICMAFTAQIVWYNVLHIGVGFYIARSDRVGNAKALRTLNKQCVRIPRLFCMPTTKSY